MIEDKDIDGLFHSTFVSLGWDRDWNEGRDDFRTLHPLSQEAFAFSVYLLGKLARDWTPNTLLVDAWL